MSHLCKVKMSHLLKGEMCHGIRHYYDEFKRIRSIITLLVASFKYYWSLILQRLWKLREI